ncbi:helix-turn-helix domain-containing protein [Variovorax sp. GrIS 2.14]|uniref:helix-turn-helix domain-containing protein n=1 Tax=Variovorax sp. GrIS 2.14 TaxID=3071709 RepID=UPI0038F647FA
MAGSRGTSQKLERSWQEVRNDARPHCLCAAALVHPALPLVQRGIQLKNAPALSTATGAFKEQLSDVIAAAPVRVDPLLSRSTTTEAQLARILAALRRSSQSTDSLRALGIYQVSARIFALRARGYSISTQLFSAVSADGYEHSKMALYTLHEPTEPWVRPTTEGGE